MGGSAYPANVEITRRLVTEIDAAPLDDVSDEEAARLDRERYREKGLPALQPDLMVAPLLADGESVVGWRQAASLSRVDEMTHAVVRDDGPLYVTSERLLHLGGQMTAF